MINSIKSSLGKVTNQFLKDRNLFEEKNIKYISRIIDDWISHHVYVTTFKKQIHIEELNDWKLDCESPMAYNLYHKNKLVSRLKFEFVFNTKTMLLLTHVSDIKGFTSKFEKELI